VQINDIESSLTFYGMIPRNSTKEHLGIVLLHDNVEVQYCYCTSQEKIKKFYKYYYEISKEDMEGYFPNEAKTSYIVLSQSFIMSLFCITFINRIDTGEFELRAFLKENIFKGLIKALLEADTISEEFKKAVQLTLEELYPSS
jgi:hypothetical protein